MDLGLSIRVVLILGSGHWGSDGVQGVPSEVLELSKVESLQP